MITDAQIVQAAQQFAKDHDLAVNIGSIHDLNTTGATLSSWADSSVLILYVAGKKQFPNEAAPRTFGLEFNSTSDAKQQEQAWTADGAEITGGQIVRSGREVTRLLFIENGVLAEGMMRVMESLNQDE